MKKYYIISEDSGLKKRLSTVIPSEELFFISEEELINGFITEGIVLIDGDSSTALSNKSFLKVTKSAHLPLVAIFENISGKSAMKYLDSGVIHIMFKEATAKQIFKKLKETLGNFEYLEKARMVVEDENRTRKFLNVINSITSDTDINEIILKLLTSMQDIFSFKTTSFYLLQNETAKKKIALNSDNNSEADYTNQVIEEKRFINFLKKLKSPVMVNSKSPKSVKSRFMAGTIIIPLSGKNSTIGFISTEYSKSHRTIPSKDRVLLKAFAEHTSVALENARLYWDVLKAREELVNQEKKALLGQMIVSLNHEINNPLSIISMEAQLLQKKLNNNKPTHNIESRITNIENNIDRIKDILEKISTLKVDSNMSVEYRKGIKMLNLYNEN